MNINRLAASTALITIFAVPGAAQRHRGGGSTGRAGTAPLTGEIAQAAVVTFNGNLRNFDKKKFLVEIDDGQTLVFRRVKHTVVQPSSIPLNVAVQVDARKEATGDLEAVRICEKACSGPPPSAPAATRSGTAQ
jgi:hypothetical protein